MTQTAFNFERTLPENPYREGTGNYRVYEWLREKQRIRLSELHHTLKVDTARIRTDIRPFLRKHGFDYEVVNIGESEREYRVI